MRLRIVWKLQGISQLPIHKGSHVSSSTFATGGRKWKLAFATADSQSSDCCRAELHAVDGSNAIVQFDFGLVASSDDAAHCTEQLKAHQAAATDFSSTPCTTSFAKQQFGHRCFPRSHLLLANSDCLIVYCDLAIPTVACSTSPLADDMRALLDCGLFSDVTLLVDDVAIPAHKAILAHHSPVFKAISRTR